MVINKPLKRVKYLKIYCAVSIESTYMYSIKHLHTNNNDKQCNIIVYKKDNHYTVCNKELLKMCVSFYMLYFNIKNLKIAVLNFYLGVN